MRILESPKLQQVLRDLDNPEDIKIIWSNFWKEKPKSSFSEFAEAEVKRINSNYLNQARSLDSEGSHSWSDHDAHATKYQHIEQLKSGVTPGGRTGIVLLGEGDLQQSYLSIFTFHDGNP